MLYPNYVKFSEEINYFIFSKVTTLKWLWCVILAWNHQFWIILNWYNPKWLVEGIWSHVESFIGVSHFSILWCPRSQNCPFLKSLHFWPQHVIENVLTHCKMKISFPVTKICEIIFVYDHTYLCILSFTFYS